MKNVKHYVGIDISKDSFDVYREDQGFDKFTNDTSGFSSFLKSLNSTSYCVMEVTGSYHLLLARYLYDHDIAVSVVNPLIIKRYIQMKLHHTKTDKSDAKMIAGYAKEQHLSLWQPEPSHIHDCKMLQTSIEVYFKQSTALKNGS